MKEYLSVIRSCRLFSGVSEEELVSMLHCLDAKKESFPKEAFLLREGDRTEYIGLVLSGSALIIQDDIWGNRNIVSKVGPGMTFAAAYACTPTAVLDISVIADTPVTVAFLNVKRILTTCTASCSHHNRVIRNLLGELAEKNLDINDKLTHISQRSTRAKLMSYLSCEARRLGSLEFDIPYSRQQLADYLAVERSGLSAEMGRMRDEGLLTFNKNHIKLQSISHTSVLSM